MYEQNLQLYVSVMENNTDPPATNGEYYDHIWFTVHKCLSLNLH